MRLFVAIIPPPAVIEQLSTALLESGVGFGGVSATVTSGRSSPSGVPASQPQRQSSSPPSQPSSASSASPSSSSKVLQPSPTPAISAVPGPSSLGTDSLSTVNTTTSPTPLISHQPQVPVLPPISWIPPQNWHLTLSFLGNVAPASLEALKKTLSEVAERHSPMRLRLEGAGHFRHKVLWVGIAGPRAAGGAEDASGSGGGGEEGVVLEGAQGTEQDARRYREDEGRQGKGARSGRRGGKGPPEGEEIRDLRHLATSISGRMRKMDVMADKRFSPHLTIGRGVDGSTEHTRQKGKDHKVTTKRSANGHVGKENEAECTQAQDDDKGVAVEYRSPVFTGQQDTLVSQQDTLVSQQDTQMSQGPISQTQTSQISQPSPDSQTSPASQTQDSQTQDLTQDLTHDQPQDAQHARRSRNPQSHPRRHHPRPPSLIPLVTQLSGFESDEWVADTIHLVQSSLGKKVRYESIASWRLGGAGGPGDEGRDVGS